MPLFEISVGASAIAAASLAVLALGLTLLSANVSRLRIRHRVSFGDGGHKDLLAASRAHGNALEQVGLYAVLVLAYASLPAARPDALGLCALVFVLARAAHAAALLGRRLLARQLAHGLSTGVHVAFAGLIFAALRAP